MMMKTVQRLIFFTPFDDFETPSLSSDSNEYHMYKAKPISFVHKETTESKNGQRRI